MLDALLEVVVLLDADMTASLARDGLTVARTRVLWLVRAQGPVTQRALADLLEVTPRNVTGLVDGLVAGGFVERSPHPDDRRATLVSLTPHAEQVVDRLAEGHGELGEQLFGSMTPEHRRAFADGLAHTLRRLHTLLDGGPA